MRVTDRLILQDTINNIMSNRQRLEDIQNRISSGKRVLRPSDDPGALAQGLRLAAGLQHMDQYRRNGDSAENWLTTTEVALRDLSGLLLRARELALQGGNDTLDAAQRLSIAAEVDQLFQRALDLSNTKYGSRYIFAGHAVLTRPFLAAANPQGFSYQGDSGSIRQEVEAGAYVTVNVPGPVAFDLSLQSLKTLRDALNTGDASGARGSLDDFDAAHNILLASVADVATRTARVIGARERLQSLTTQSMKELSAAMDVDMAEALVELNARQNVYMASLKAGAQAITPSLLEFLR